MIDKREYEGDEALVEAMCEIYEACTKKICGWEPEKLRRMTAALRVARESLWAQWAKEKPAERELTHAEWERVRQAFLEARRSSHIADPVPALKAAYAEIKLILSEPAVDPRWEAYRAANDRLRVLRGNVDEFSPAEWEELRRLMPEEGK